MNVLILHGSPRKDGSSDTLVKHFARGLNTISKNQIKEFFANDVNVRPCQGCLTCAKLGNNTCVIEDDMQRIYSAFLEADIVVWATPMYWGYMTAQLKTILDRMEALACGPEENWKDKTFVVIITYHYHYESTVAFFERITPFFGVKPRTIVYHSLSKRRSLRRTRFKLQGKTKRSVHSWKKSCKQCLRWLRHTRRLPSAASFLIPSPWRVTEYCKLSHRNRAHLS